MKSILENYFNDSGSPSDPHYKKQFLSQRKWIIILASLFFLLSNSYVELAGNIGPLTFRVSPDDQPMLIAITSSCLLFFGYMLFSSYAYIAKFNVEKKEAFAKLQIEERDVYSEELASLLLQENELVENLNTKTTSRSSWQIQNLKILELISELRSQFPDIGIEAENFDPDAHDLATIGIEVASQNLKKSLSVLPLENAPRIKTPTDPKEALDLYIAAQNQLTSLSKLTNDDTKSIDQLQRDLDGIRNQKTDVEKSRAKITLENKTRWQTYYAFGVVKDIISFVPAFIGVVYCGNYLRSIVLNP